MSAAEALLSDPNWAAFVSVTSPRALPSSIEAPAIIRAHAGRRPENDCFMDRNTRRRILGPKTMLTDFFVDNFLHVSVAPKGHRTEMCRTIPNILVPVFLEVASAERPPSFNGTRERYGVHATDTASRSQTAGTGPSATDRKLERSLRKIAGRIRKTLDNTSGPAVTVFPVVHMEHFWLYIVDWDNSVVEYYDSKVSYMRPGRSRDFGSPHVDSSVITNGHEYERWIRGDESVDVAPAGPANWTGNTQQDITVFHASVLWFVHNYFGRRMRVLDMFTARTDRQTNTTDCGIFLCAYAYIRTVIGVEYQEIVGGVRQRHIPAFRSFLVRLCGDTFAGTATTPLEGGNMTVDDDGILVVE